MITVILRIFAGCLLVLALGSVPARAQDVIQWRITDWPPGHITEGPFEGRGTFDFIISYLESNLPEYGHIRVEMNFRRLTAEMKKGINVCYVSATPKDFAHTSVVDVAELPHKIFIRKDKLHLVDGRCTVSLEELLADTRLKAGVCSTRYTDRLDAIVGRHLGRNNVTDVAGYTNLIRMLFEGRVDFIIEYASVMRYYEKRLEKENLVTGLDILETMEQSVIIGRVACPITP